VSEHGKRSGEGALPIIACTERLRLKGVTFLRLHILKREGISKGEVYEKVGKSVI